MNVKTIARPTEVLSLTRLVYDIVDGLCETRTMSGDLLGYVEHLGSNGSSDV